MFKVLVLVSLFTFFGCSGKSQIVIETDIYRIEYSEQLEQPTKIEYTIKCPNGDVPRYGKDFWKPGNIHTSDDQDYVNNIWDKGHMVPVSSFSCTEESLHQTFNFVNCSLQHQSLNRGVWRTLEEFERTLANFYQVNVVIYVIFDEIPYKVKGGASVPLGYRKVLNWGAKTLVTEFPNEDTSGHSWVDFIIDYK